MKCILKFFWQQQYRICLSLFLSFCPSVSSSAYCPPFLRHSWHILWACSICIVELRDSTVFFPTCHDCLPPFWIIHLFPNSFVLIFALVKFGPYPKDALPGTYPSSCEPQNSLSLFLSLFLSCFFLLFYLSFSVSFCFYLSVFLVLCFMFSVFCFLVLSLFSVFWSLILTSLFCCLYVVCPLSFLSSLCSLSSSYCWWSCIVLSFWFVSFWFFLPLRCLLLRVVACQMLLLSSLQEVRCSGFVCQVCSRLGLGKPESKQRPFCWKLFQKTKPCPLLLFVCEVRT